MSPAVATLPATAPPLLDIKDLHVSVAQQPVLRGLSLSLRRGEVHAIMGPNGSGKSTLAHVLAGRPGYDITAGSVQFEGQDLLALAPEQRARAGLFLGFQYPVEIPGVNNAYLLRAALNAARRERGQPEVDAFDFLGLVRRKMELMQINEGFLGRGVNEGFSGGEKKRNEILQMLVLEPSLALLDETDSGLDIDALKIVAHGVNSMRGAERSIVLVTHYQRLLEYIVPDQVHVLARGRIASVAIARWRWNWSAVVTIGWLPRDRARRPQPSDPGSHSGQYDAAQADSPQSASPQRQQAAQRLRQFGWPSWREEHWRHANLQALDDFIDFRAATPVATPAAIDASLLPEALPGFERWLFVDGVRRSVPSPDAASRPDLPRSPDAGAWSADERLGLLTELFATDSAQLQIRGEARVELLFYSSAASRAAVYPRLQLDMAANSRLTLVERHWGGNPDATPGQPGRLVCASATIQIAAGAELDHYRLQQCAADITFADTLVVQLQARAHYRARQITTGAHSARTTARIQALGADARISWQGIAVGRGEQQHDTAVRIDHLAPATHSEQIFRGIVDDHALSAFGGHIQVGAQAAGANAAQSHARTDRRRRRRDRPASAAGDPHRRGAPSHGATTGKLDEQPAVLPADPRPGPGRRAALLKWAFLGDVLRPDRHPGTARRGPSRPSRRAAARRRGLDGAAGMSANPGVAAGTGYDVEPVRARFPDPGRVQCTASRWSISTAPPPRSSRWRCCAPSRLRDALARQRAPRRARPEPGSHERL